MRSNLKSLHTQIEIVPVVNCVALVAVLPQIHEVVAW